MGRIVIACYKPKPGKLDELRALTKGHVSALQAEGLATDRAAIVMEAADGTVIEVFEWKSPEAIDAAHSNPTIMAIWERFHELCDYVPIGSVEEARQVFSGFTPLH
jgi:quinol monooxygenase YgiN